MLSLATAIAALENDPTNTSRVFDMLDPALIEDALKATGKATVRNRKVPAEQAVWLSVGLSLFADRSMKNVARTLQVGGAKGVVPSSLSDARKRLGSEPMENLFHITGERWTQDVEGGTYLGMSLYGVDGTVMNIQDTATNERHFGRPGSKQGKSAYPQARVTALMNLKSRTLRAAVISPLCESEHLALSELKKRLPENSICITDRGFQSYRAFCGISDKEKNRHFLCRVKNNSRYRFEETLSDGSMLITVEPSSSADKSDAELQKKMTLRRIEYRVEGSSTKYILYTSLLNQKRFSQRKLAEMYHARWELEIAFDELKTDLLHRKECLRSKQPYGVEQEIWALLLMYNMVRREMALTAREHGVEPADISFRESMHAVREFFFANKADPTTCSERLASRLRVLRHTIWVNRLPPRRSERSNPRVVKIKMSGYLRKAGISHQVAQSA